MENQFFVKNKLKNLLTLIRISGICKFCRHIIGLWIESIAINVENNHRLFQ